MRASILLRNINATPPPQSKAISPHISFYKFYGRPLVRVFLMTSVTYYSLHYLWWSLDYDEMSESKGREISQLEDELARVTLASGTQLKR